MNGFEAAGLCPFNPEKVLGSVKLLPSLQFSSEKQLNKLPTKSDVHKIAIAEFEKVLRNEKVKKFEVHLEEDYDLLRTGCTL